jgi:hypothetical protein
MRKPLTQVADKQMSLANTFQPQASRILNAKTKTYQPVGAVQIPKVVPPLISGVAARPTPPVPSSASAQGAKK